MEWLQFFGGFFGSIMTLLATLAAVTYAHDLQLKHEREREKEELRTLAMALRAECRGIQAAVIARWVMLEKLIEENLKAGDSDWIDMPTNFLLTYTFPRADLIAGTAGKLSLLSGKIAEQLLALKYMLDTANDALHVELADIRKAPIDDQPRNAGRFEVSLPLRGLKSIHH